MSPDLERTEENCQSVDLDLENRLQAALRCDQPVLWLFLLRALAEGKPVTLTEIAGAFEMSASEVREALTVFRDIEYDDEGNVVACGLSLVPTPHRFRVDGRDLFTWCALDALMYPVALGQTAQVESPCPVTDVAVRLTVTLEGVTFMDPAGAVVAVVVPDSQAGCCSMRGAFCSQVHFLSSPQAAAAWRSKHPEAAILSIEEAWLLGRAIVRRRVAAGESCAAP